MAYSLSSTTPFNFEFRFGKNFFGSSYCRIIYEGKERPEKIWDIKDRDYQTLQNVFHLVRDFEDMVCSLTESEIRYIDGKEFAHLTSIFMVFYTKYQNNFVDTDKTEAAGYLRDLRDFRLGEEIIHGYPKSVKFEGTTLTIVFYINYNKQERTLQIPVPINFSKMVKIGLAANLCSNIRSSNLFFLYNFYVAAGWSNILNKVYGYSPDVPERIIKKLPQDIIDSDRYFGYWKLHG